MKKVLYIAMAFAALALVSCNKFLDRPSKTVMDDNNLWTSESNVRLFVNDAYFNYFNGYHNGWSYSYAPGVRGDSAPTEWSDDICTSGTQLQPLNAATDVSGVTVSESVTFNNRVQSCNYNMAFVRKWNLLIARLETMKEKSVLTDEQYNHWMGVARFLRAYEYSRLVMSFGDVPYFDAVIEATDEVTQYKQPDSRVTVMTKCMEDFKYAMENVRLDDGDNYINKGVVGTYGSRFMLFEGTWEKYHKTAGGNPTQFLQAAQDLAAAVMATGKYQFNCSFKDLFASTSQVGNETIMFRSYSAAASVRHCIATYCMPQYGQGGYATFANLESWVCNDGHIVYTSTTPNAESWRVQDMRITRDPRFEATFYNHPIKSTGGSLFAWKWIDRAGPEAYYENQRSGAAIPTQYGSAYNINGAPVIRYAEVVLNWIEAKAELGAVSQADLDKSINAIRQRPLDATETALGCKQTAPLTLALAEANAEADPQYNDAALYATTLAAKNGFPQVSPILWEIRRERRMEFFLEHTRATDIRRWGILENINNENNPKTTYTAWIEPSELGEDKAEYRVDGKVNPSDPRYFSIYPMKYVLTPSDFDLFRVVGLDGKTHIYAGTKNDAGAIIESNLSEMAGFKIPTNFINRRNVSERDYIFPYPSGLINDYKEKHDSNPDIALLEQNPLWK